MSVSEWGQNFYFWVKNFMGSLKRSHFSFLLFCTFPIEVYDECVGFHLASSTPFVWEEIKLTQIRQSSLHVFCLHSKNQANVDLVWGESGYPCKNSWFILHVFIWFAKKKTERESKREYFTMWWVFFSLSVYTVAPKCVWALRSY